MRIYSICICIYICMHFFPALHQLDRLQHSFSRRFDIPVVDVDPLEAIKTSAVGCNNLLPQSILRCCLGTPGSLSAVPEKTY